MMRIIAVLALAGLVAAQSPPPPLMFSDELLATDLTCEVCFEAGVEAGLDQCDSISVRSDPHISGLNKQSFDFTGESGKYYALVSDTNFAINARFGTGYTTGLTVDQETMVTSLMRAQGTWLTELAFIMGEHVIEISIEPSPLESLCPKDSRLKTCFFGGSVRIDHDDIIRVGNLPVGDGISVTLANKNSFGRMDLHAQKGWRFDASVDYVPAPDAWKLNDKQKPEYAHLNIRVKKIALSSEAHGVLGQTTRIKYDDKGNAILTAKDHDGKGLIDGVATDYQLDNLLSTDFKYSIFAESKNSGDGWAEGTLNSMASFFNREM